MRPRFLSPHTLTGGESSSSEEGRARERCQLAATLAHSACVPPDERNSARGTVAPHNPAVQWNIARCSLVCWDDQPSNTSSIRVIFTSTARRAIVARTFINVLFVTDPDSLEQPGRRHVNLEPSSVPSRTASTFGLPRVCSPIWSRVWPVGLLAALVQNQSQWPGRLRTAPSYPFPCQKSREFSVSVANGMGDPFLLSTLQPSLRRISARPPLLSANCVRR